MKSLPFLFLVLLPSLASAALAGIHLRTNLAGHDPSMAADVVVMSDRDLQGIPWALRGPAGDTILRGTMGPSFADTGWTSPALHNHRVDLGVLGDTGLYVLRVGPDTLLVRVRRGPTAFLVREMMQHVQAMRKGSDARLTAPAHAGDSANVVWRPAGNPALGRWIPDSLAPRIDTRGGWYDAGDHIQFTLPAAYAIWAMFTAWDRAGAIFPDDDADGVPDLLAEAIRGARWLMRMHPSPDVFVIQVGDARDHRDGIHLPEHDPLDGDRPALVALSAPHMALACAALARGAVVLSRDPSNRALSDSLGATADRLWDRLAGPGILRNGAFERDTVGGHDFYRDNTASDNLALAAAEMARLRGRPGLIDTARSRVAALGQEIWAGWSSHGLSARTSLAEVTGDWSTIPPELTGFRDFAADRGAPWGIPMEPTWGLLDGATLAAAAFLRWGEARADSALQADGRRILDWTLGRNAWGRAMVYSRRVRGAVRHIYHPTYQILGEFPTGAWALGPGSRTTSVDLGFEPCPDTSFVPFQTAWTVWCDNPRDFQKSETTISLMGAAFWMLAEAARQEGLTAPVVLPPLLAESTDPPTTDSLPVRWWNAPASSWYVFDDRGENGISTAVRLPERAGRAVFRFATDLGPGLPYAYAGAGMPVPSGNGLVDARWLVLELDLPRGRLWRIDLQQSDISDFDHWGVDLAGRGDTTYVVDLTRLSRQGWSTVDVPWNPSRVQELTIVFGAERDTVELAVGRMGVAGDLALSMADRSPEPSRLVSVRRGPRGDLRLGLPDLIGSPVLLDLRGRILGIGREVDAGWWSFGNVAGSGGMLVIRDAAGRTWKVSPAP